MKQITFYFCILMTICVKAQTVEKITELYNNKDFNQVITLGKQVLLSDPDNPFVNSIVGRAFKDTKQIKEAIPYLIKGTIETENKPYVRAWSYVYLGECYFLTDDYNKSKECYYKCLQLNATENVTKKAQISLKQLQMDETYEKWDTISSAHLRFHFQAKDRIPNIENYIKSREAAYIEINRFFNAAPYKKIDFYVWNNREEAKIILGQELGFANANSCIINTADNQTRGHEIAHILLVYGINPKQKTAFINEGVATFFDQTDRNRMEAAKQVNVKEAIDVLDLWDNPKKYSYDLNYTIGGAWIEFLSKKGTEEQLKKLLADQTSESAKSVYGNFDSLIIEFENLLKN